MKRTKKEVGLTTVVIVIDEATDATKETAQAVQEFVDAVPLKNKPRIQPKPQRVRVPHTKDGGIDWTKFLNGGILTARPEGMPYDVYKQLLYEQKWKLKMRNR